MQRFSVGDFSSKIFGKYCLSDFLLAQFLWGHSKISFGRSVAGANETKSKICWLKISDISLIFATSYF